MVVAIIKEVFDSATVKLNHPENGPDDNEYDEEVAIENNELEINRGETVDPPAAVTNKAQDDETNSENFYFHHYVIENDRSLNEDYRRVEEGIENVVSDDNDSDDSVNDEIDTAEHIVKEIHVDKDVELEELCEWEKIRNSIIEERQQWIAESKIMDEIKETRAELVTDKVNKDKKKPKKEVDKTFTPRRSGRVKSCVVATGESPEDNIEIEIKIELEYDNDHVNNEIVIDCDVNTANSHEAVDTIVGSENIRIEENLERENNLVENSDVVRRINLVIIESAENKKECYDIITALLSDLINKVVPMNCERKGKTYVCSECDYLAKDNCHLKRHKENMHRQIDVQCVRCEAVFNNKFKFTQHSKTCHLVCPYFGCSKTFKYIYKLEAHRRSHKKMLRRMI